MANLLQTNGDLSLWHWLVQSEAEAALAQTLQALKHGDDELRILTGLRRSYGRDRAAAILGQTQLRRKASEKFSAAPKMLFTSKGLAQSTSQAIAQYKASRIPARPPVDLCCGIGGDLIGLGQRGSACGVDRDPVSTFCAVHNCRVNGASAVSVECADAATIPLDDFPAIHIDPDRRTGSQRTTDLRHFSPGLPMIEPLLERDRVVAIKLAPATQLPNHWYREFEIEWIGHRTECKQQVVWRSGSTSHRGRRVATVISDDGSQMDRIIESKLSVDRAGVGSLRRYLFEPHAAVLAANLADDLAAHFGAHHFSSNVAYLTLDQPVDSRLASCFEVLDVVPLNAKTLRESVRDRSETIAEIKTRGLRDIDISAFRRLPCGDSQGLSIVLTRVANQPRALLCRRRVNSPTNSGQ